MNSEYDASSQQKYEAHAGSKENNGTIIFALSIYIFLNKSIYNVSCNILDRDGHTMYAGPLNIRNIGTPF